MLTNQIKCNNKLDQYPANNNNNIDLNNNKTKCSKQLDLIPTNNNSNIDFRNKINKA